MQEQETIPGDVDLAEMAPCETTWSHGVEIDQTVYETQADEEHDG